MTLQWAPPFSIPGLLKEYHIIAQLLSPVCEPNTLTTAQPAPEDELTLDCVDSNVTVSVNASDGVEENHNVTLHSLAKYRYYRFKVAAVTNAGIGEYTHWNYARTLAGSKITVMISFCVARRELAVRQNIFLCISRLNKYNPI